MQTLPFVCFIEQQSGLLVLISYSGYCLKFQLETKIDEPDIEVARRQPMSRQRQFSVETAKNQQSQADREEQQAQEANPLSQS